MTATYRNFFSQKPARVCGEYAFKNGTTFRFGVPGSLDPYLNSKNSLDKRIGAFETESHDILSKGSERVPMTGSP
jgi:hypothetical protein